MLRQRGRNRTGGAAQPALLLDFLNAPSSAASVLTFSRASTATYTDSAGVLQTAASGAARFDYDPVTHAAKGLLIEEARTNLLKWSSDYTQTSAWGSQCVVTASATTAPDGTISACLVADANTGSATAAFQSATVANDSAAYTLSVYYKSGTTTAFSPRIAFLGGTATTGLCNVNPSTDAITSSTFTAARVDVLPNGWRRFVGTCSNNGAGNTTAQAQFYIDNTVAAGTGNIYLWGAQLEQGSFPSSYIPTTSAAATRAADVCSMALSSVPGWSATQGTVVVEAAPGPSGFRAIAELGDGTYNNRHLLFVDGSNNRSASVTVGGAGQAVLTSGTFTAGATVKGALAFAVNDFSLSSAGAAPSTDTSGTLPTPTTLYLGYQGGGGGVINGTIGRLRLYNRRLSNAQLQGLSA